MKLKVARELQMKNIPTIKFKKLFINEEFVDSVLGKTFETVDPRTEEVIIEIAEATKEDVDIAVKVARQAFDNGLWPRMSGAERVKIMVKWTILIEENIEEVAALDTIDGGKLYSWCKVVDVPEAANILQYYVCAANKIHGDVAPSLAAGCTMILKPTEQTPLSALFYAHLAKHAEIPDGVFNVVPGFGATAGAAISSHMDIDVSFTSLIEIGRRVMQAVALRNLKLVSLKLGGKSPIMVFDDADVDKAFDLALFGILHNKGEVCVAFSRVFVEERKNKAQFDKILSYIEHGKNERATLLHGVRKVGTKDTILSLLDSHHIDVILEGLPSEYAPVVSVVEKPTIFTNVKDDMLIAQDEIFGLVMTHSKFKNIDEAIKKANNTKYGLAAGIVNHNLEIAFVRVSFGSIATLPLIMTALLEVKSIATPIYNSPWL
ncbi:unnamed protein product [Vicia faba]|uniref:Aldehyde dehydrogenase domain-containing protein n=1 Tax=Vicia faba TaxID=3906 RepID=A0AAV0Z823_VICFA|nr:unnamed protein product [Vicia faba]